MTTIAEILHTAADEYLWAGPGDRRRRTSPYSCLAIGLAEGSPYDDPWPSPSIRSGLEELGVSCHALGEFSEFTKQKDRQGARYAWLKFAALLAEEQGV